MNQQPLVSVILPVYNGEQWLARSLGSLQAQTYQNFECVMVNDGSTDGSRAVCAALAEKDPRFRLLDKENGGVSSARNAALAQLRGEWFTFCDQDDAMDPHSLEYAVTMQTAHPDRLVMWGYTRDAADFAAAAAKPLEFELTDGDSMLRRHPCGSIFVTIWNKLFNTAAVRAAGLRFDETLGKRDNLGEDKLFMEQYLAARWPDTPVPMAYAATPRYFHYPDNRTSITRTATQRLELTLPDPEPGYAAFILAEYRAARAEMPARLTDIPPLESIAFVRHYTRCFAFALWCAEKLQEGRPVELTNGPELAELLNWWQTNRIFNPYYLPLRWRMFGFAARLYQWDELKQAPFFRFCQLFRLLLPGWKANAGE